MKQIQEIKNNFIEARDLLDEFIKNEDNWQAIEKAGNTIINAIKNNKKIISCGNGGSMSDAMHFAEELTGRRRTEASRARVGDSLSRFTGSEAC